MSEAYDETSERGPGMAEAAQKAGVLDALVQRLEADAEKRIQNRQQVEARWLQDILQYEGHDDLQAIAQLEAANRSTAVVNITRAKCNVFESKLFDMLFPTDDKNWGIDPTPVPELDMEAKRVKGDVERITAEANAEEDDARAAQLRDEADALAQRMAELENDRQEARQSADLMTEEIDDNLVECEYPVHCRSVIHDATVVGTGILKGPMPLSERIRKSWIREDGGVYRLRFDPESTSRFAYQHVSYWHLFPNNGVRSFDHVDSWMERHIMRRRDWIEFAKQPGVDQDAVREILREGPQDVLPQYMVNLDYASGEQEAATDREVWVMWEYRGPLETDEMEAMVRTMADEDETGPSAEEMDPLTQMDAVVWFCQGHAVRFGVNHMDDNSSVYSVFQIERSETRLWSIGVPYLMRTQAEILNDAWRGMLDNAAWAGFPLIEIDTGVVQRADGGDNVVEPGSVWERLASAAADRLGFYFHTVPIQQEAYAALINLTMQFFDQETNISVLAAGEQGAVTKTAGGMALLMNSVNVVFRRVVKNWDDGITSPTVSRAYHFEMQFSDKEEIKGDYAVKARGSSVLLVREIQAQNLMVLMMQVAQNPTLGMHIKLRSGLKRLLQSMMIPADDLLKTQDELERDIAKAEEEAANAPPDPAMVKLQLERELAQMEADLKIQLAEMQTEGDMVKLAAQRGIALETIMGRLQAVREQSQSKERIFAGEAAIEARQPPGNGSGGYLSAGGSA